MNIAIFASGSQGDVQPYLALSAGLRRAGHAVKLVTHEPYAQTARGLNLEFHALQGNPQELMDSPKMRELLAKGNFLEIQRHTSIELKRVNTLWAQTGLEACADVDLILAGVGGLFTGLSVAEKLDKAFVFAPVFPFTPTAAFPSPLFPGTLSKLGGWANRLSHTVTRQIMWQGARAATNNARVSVLGLPPISAPYSSPRFNRFPTLYGFSPSVIPQPSDWNNAVVTGYWTLEAGADWTPPADLEQFLSSGEPPVFIGFGSMGSRDPEATARLVLEAVRSSGKRAILQSGWGGLRAGDLPDTVHMIGQVPHAWLFSKVAAVVHHGGAGTTAAGLRAGLPTLVTPFFGDQGFWGERVAMLGVGVAPIPRKRLTAPNLAAGLERLTTDVLMRERAARLGERIRAEDGVRNAVAELERLRL
jgi:UDP:flavonoid glycosyltransferase YjiC (YdhE family)